MRAIVCDCCGKVLTKQKDIEKAAVLTMNSPDEHGRVALMCELCEACARTIAGMVDGEQRYDRGETARD